MNFPTNNVSTYTDIVRLNINKKIHNKLELEQYFSSVSLSKLMASMMNYDYDEIDILDPGAGIGSLFVACVDEIFNQGLKPKKISITAYEIDKSLFRYLDESLKQCKKLCEKNKVEFTGKIIKKDFIVDIVENLKSSDKKQFSHIIINPPYKKINIFSEVCRILKKVNLPSANLYTAFIALSEKVLKENGEIVFISPRSFCNGPYFQSFRKKFLESMSLKRIHIFNSRSSSFSDDGVLQENVIVHAVKTKKLVKDVLISSNSNPDDEDIVINHVKKNAVVYPNDSQYFIHIVPDEISVQVSDKIRQLESTLKDLDIDASTGKVVDFRIKEALRRKSDGETVPLIHPFNLLNGSIKFPIQDKKENYIEITKKSKNLLISNGNYVLVKRFSTKEEKKRIVASVWSKNDFDFQYVGFENRINYFHKNGNSLNLNIAKGLSLFLNSTLVDLYFRQFNGHTQVNATDLRYLRYPTYDQLKTLGSKITKKYPDQKEIDDIIEKVLFSMSQKSDKINPIPTKEKIDEAIEILKQLGFPKQQQNDRSALTLLSLLDLKPNGSWNASKNPMCGITPMMEYFEKHYGKKYAPNSRETVRRQTVHQFIQSGLVIQNPDNPERPTNSGKTVYQIEDNALHLLRSFNTSNWTKELQIYQKSRPSLQQKYRNERKMKKIPLILPSGETLGLSPGGQNVLVEKIYTEFAPRFVPMGIPLLIGDTAKNSGYSDESGLKKLGIILDSHGKKPDVIIYDRKNNWLLVIEAVTSHGPIEPKRQIELKKIFSKSKIGVVFVTTFLDQKEMLKYFNNISWETEVWTADEPDHMIHFNGSKFLGPY